MKQGGWWLIGALVVAGLLAWLAVTPPMPEGTAADATSPSSQRAFVHVERIAAEPHVTGSEANAAVREYLVAELDELGLSVSMSGGTLGERSLDKLGHWQGREIAGPVPFVNVVGVLPGRDRSLPAVALMAHYDSVWGSPGASDDATGVAAILESVRAITAQEMPQRDIVVIFTDAEELGLVGARKFFANDPLADRIGAIVNLEARGGGGIASMFQTSPGNGELARFYADTVARPATSSLSAFIYSVLPNDTDLTAALDRGGYAAFNIAFIGRSGLYHSPLATPANLDRGSLEHMLSQTHALAMALANAKELPRASANAVFFDTYGLATVVYPAWLGWVMLALAIGGYWLAWRRREERGGALAGAGRMLGFIVAGGAVLYALNLLSGAGGGAGYYDRLAAIPKLTWMASATVLAAIAALWGAKQPETAGRIGTAAPLFLLALIAQVFAPTAAYFIVIPVTLAALVEAISGETARRIAAAIVAALVTGYMLAIGFQMMQGVGPSMPYIAMLPAALALLTWLPLWPGLPKPRLVALAFLLGAVALALWVRFDPIPPTVAVYSPLKPG